MKGNICQLKMMYIGMAFDNKIYNMEWKSIDKIPLITSDQDVLIVYGTNMTSDIWIPASVLTKDEIIYCHRIREINHRNIWISSRAILRTILGNYMKSDPTTVDLRKNRFGRLYLPGSDLYFNVSHTNTSWLIGFNFGGKIGLDIEKLNGSEDLESLMVYAFSPTESEYCRHGDLTNRFLEIWTLKEAFLKAAGVGLVDNLNLVNVLGIKENDILSRELNHETIVCPNGEFASIVFRNNRHVNYFSVN